MKFAYSMPTRIISGEGCLVENAALLKEMGNKALIVTGRNSARANGSLDDALKALALNGQEYVLFDKVMSNPTVACTLEGAAVMRDGKCDFVLAIGGGSPMDAGKAMALLAARDEAVDPARIFSTAFTKAYPVVAVPTTAGTGSEATQYSILINDEAETKSSIATPLIFPRLAFLDARYMNGLSQTITINTAIDALSHAIEGMLAARASDISDGLARQSIAMLMGCFAPMREGNISAQNRADLLCASTLAGMVIANTGTTAVHAMGYLLTYYKNVDHGRANGLLLPEFMAFAAKHASERVQSILDCMGLTSLTDFAALLDGLLGTRETLSPEELVHYAEKASMAGNIGNCLVRPQEKDLLAVLTAALG